MDEVAAVRERRERRRGERGLDTAIDSLGCLRLTTESAHILHMGNRPPESIPGGIQAVGKKGGFLQRLAWLPGIRHGLLWLYNQIFRLYFLNAK